MRIAIMCGLGYAPTLPLCDPTKAILLFQSPELLILPLSIMLAQANTP